MVPAKLVVQSALAGLYGGLVVALLVTLLNPGGGAGAGLPILLVVTAVYTMTAAFLWPALYGALRFFASRRLHLAWINPRYILIFHAANMTVILISAWTTLSRSRGAIAPGARDHLELTCWSLSFAWLITVIVLVIPRLGRRTISILTAMVIALIALIAPATMSRGEPDPPFMVVPQGPRGGAPTRHLLLLNFDGADLGTILALEAEGKLPSFSRLREEGTYGRLRSVRPCAAPVTRATLLTGRLPYSHGVRGARGRRLLGWGPSIEVVPMRLGFDWLLGPLFETRSRTIEDRTALALWEIVSRLGGGGREAGWLVDLDDPAAVTRSSGLGGAGVRGGTLREILDPDAARAADPDAQSRLAVIMRGLEADAEVTDSFERLIAECPAGVTAISFPGLDAMAHTFLRHARPELFGDVTAAEVESYGDVLQRYYRRMDGIVGRAASACGGEGFLFVTSSHGIDPEPLGRRIFSLLTGGELPSGIHERGPYGFLFARGPNLKAGETFGKGSIIDIAPTALYALELPIASDMDGRLLTEAFTPRYIARHPVTVIGTYEPKR
ncbi:MAG: alkaline phosphatase family protein [Acidobacteriota bacterium]